MASQFEAQNINNSIDDDTLEYYDKFNRNAIDKPLTEEEAEIIKPSSAYILGKTSSRIFSLNNREELALKYRSKGNNRLRLLPSSTKNGQKRHLHFTLPQKLHEFTIRNGNNNILYKKTTDTSINGFKNSSSTNNEPKVQQKQQNIEPEKFFRSVNLPPQQELHSHQTRSIIDSDNIPKVDEAVSSSSGSGISFNRVEVSWIAPSIPITTILAISLLGIIVLGIFIIFWLKNLLFHRNKRQNDLDHTKNSKIIQTGNQNHFSNNLRDMDNYDHQNTGSSTTSKTYKNDINNDVEVISNSPTDLLHSSFDNLKINQTPKTDVLLVDKQSSPIILETSTNSCNRFLFTPTISSLSTTTLNSSLFNDNQITGTISIPIPIPVPVPVPIPIPVPIPTHQVFPQQLFRLEKSNQQQAEPKTPKKFIRPILVKSSSTTSAVTNSSSSHNLPIFVSTAVSSSPFRRFSLCERRSNSPQAVQPAISHLKAHSVSRLPHPQKDRDDLESNFVQQIFSSRSPASAQNSPDPNTELLLGRQIIYDNCSSANTDDKENEIPVGEEVYSPKMKQSEQALAQQNSPRNFEISSTSSATTKFTFSPKQVFNNSENNANPTASPPIFSSTACQSSPLLTSAVYKHGNYFKFPEVDCIMPDKRNKVDVVSVVRSTDIDGSASANPKIFDDPKITTTPSKTKPNLSTPINQATRRARLKSISLDSDGARLVEDNLGIPVEELIEIANISPTLGDDCFVFDDTTHNQNDLGISSNSEKDDQHDDVNHNKGVHIDNAECGLPHKPISKNKTNLKIDINSGTKFEDELQKDSDDVKLVPNVQTPKTPTLTQTKQKAISLDSSDPTIIYCLPPTNNLGASRQRQLSSGNTASLLQISSMSVPTTPKRQQQLLLCGDGISTEQKFQSNKNVKGRFLSTSGKLAMSKSSTSSTPSTSFDHENTPRTSGFLSKLRSFNENTIDDNYYDDENFYLEADGGMVVVSKKLGISRSRELSSDLEDESYPIVTGFTGSNSNLLGANLQNQKCTSSLSLSNNNLKTLPEVMTISDFSTDTQEQYSEDDRKVGKSAITSVPFSANVGISKTPRHSILQRRGSNHSLTLNLNGSLGNLTKSLSVSNYSLGNANLQTSQYNLFGSSSNLSHHQILTTSAAVTPICLTQEPSIGPLCNMKISENNGNHTMSIPTNSNNGNNKKNLLQRRGSNTSLTLNIKGSSCMSLNRFNSHSSLNISLMPHQYSHQIQHHTQNQSHHSGNIANSTTTKRGLLERRNSNASLTLNIHNRALSISNCNLRGSACSLSSNPMDYENNLTSEQHTEQESQQKYDIHYATSAKHRKFLSSENLNNITQCSKLNQTHIRNSTKTCFGSVSDLKPHQPHQQPSNDMRCTYTNIEGDTTNSKLNSFGQSNLCSCTGVRNITTKPLSPQSTSEDFKMYLANIQLLQNATNILNEEHLRKFSYIFEKSYSIDKNITTTTDIAERTETDECINDDIIDITINFEAPNDDEQKLLLRNLHQEFWDLPTNYQEKPLVFGSQAKNRYKTILPNEHSRVILDCELGCVQEPYINANYIKGPDYAQNSYIATQGPMSNTIYEYWLMIYQNVAKFNLLRKQQQASLSLTTSSAIKNKSISSTSTRTPTTSKSLFTTDFSVNNRTNNCNIKNKECNSGNIFNQKIIMLTNFIENGRQKCSIYFPIDDGKLILITNQNEKIDNGDLVEFYEKYLITYETDDDNFDNINDSFHEIIIDDEKIFNKLPKFNYFIIKNCGIRKKNGFTIRKLLCFYCPINEIETEKKYLKQTLFKFVCYHYWFPDWPDHRSPNDIDVLLDMSLHLIDGCCEYDFYKKQIELKNNSQYIENQPLPIIHCSAGIGRTGCLAAILNGLQQMRSSLEQFTATSNEIDNNIICEKDSNNFKIGQKNTINVDILGIVCNLRLHRGGMVQNSEQYELIHRALCLYLKRLDLERK